MVDRTFPTPSGEKELTRQDFVSDQMVRWCPGCGDFAILAQVQKVCARLGLPREKHVFISGIGCSSRFPYYMNTYGFHSIHGRAPAIATGLKCARPDLTVWVVTGDGDGLSIGGNHLIHATRRNVDINILLFNNQIYGLTKGQFSPTSQRGKVTKSSPYGTIGRPMHPLRIALAAEATFAARSVDMDALHLSYVLERAARHKGTSFVEIYQNCITFNDKVFEKEESRATREDYTVKLEHAKPLVFGKDKDRGIRMNGMRPEVVEFPPGEPPPDILTHNERAGQEYAYLLTRLEPPAFPTPMGVLRAVDDTVYNELLENRVRSALESGPGDLGKLLAGSDSWEVR
ncbi:2-oxoacid:ferredoxin oxidoreductase subunit beta [Elusimicrobiota bacterium]